MRESARARTVADGHARATCYHAARPRPTAQPTPFSTIHLQVRPPPTAPGPAPVSASGAPRGRRAARPARGSARRAVSRGRAGSCACRPRQAAPAPKKRSCLGGGADVTRAHVRRDQAAARGAGGSARPQTPKAAGHRDPLVFEPAAVRRRGTRRGAAAGSRWRRRDGARGSRRASVQGREDGAQQSGAGSPSGTAKAGPLAGAGEATERLRLGGARPRAGSSSAAAHDLARL